MKIFCQVPGLMRQGKFINPTNTSYEPYLLWFFIIGRICYAKKRNYFVKTKRKRRIFMKKLIVLFLCVAVLTCSVVAMPAMDAEAAKKFGTLRNQG